MNMKAAFLRLVFGALLVVFALRDYLFGTGLYVYRDWSWPLSTQLTPRSVLSPTAMTNGAPDPFGFSRMFLTWPIYLVDRFTTNFVLAEKTFIVYLFSVFILISFVFAELLVKLLNGYSSNPLRGWRKEAFILFTVILVFANFWSIQQLSDLYFTAMTEFLLVAISVITILLRNADIKAMILAGVALTLCIFLDPNIYAFGFITIAIVTASVSFWKKLRLSSLKRAIVRIAMVFLVSLPSLVTIVYAIEYSTGTNLRAPGTYLTSTNNLSLQNAIRLLGFTWSLVAYGPPSLLNTAASISSLPAMGSPSYALLPGGFLTGFWLASTWALPVCAFLSVAVARYRRVSIPAAVVASFGLLMTQPQLFPFPYLLEQPLAGVPILGGAFSTVFAIPDHILVMVALAYVILASISVFALITSNFPQRRSSPKHGLGSTGSFPTLSVRNKRLKWVLLGVTLCLLIFPSWQLFSGSFFPSGYTPGQGGNGIPNSGSFTPAVPPQNMIAIYNWLLSQPNSFNIYWPGADGASYSWSNKSTPSIAWVDSPKPTYLTSSAIPGMFPEPLRFLLSTNLTADVAEYLGALDIRYLILQPYSPTGLDYSWGISNYTTLTSTLQHTPGLYLAKVDGDISVFGVYDTWGPVYRPDFVFDHPTGESNYAVAYNALSSLGVHVAITNSSQIGTRLCIDEISCAVSITSPSFLAENLPSDTSLVCLNGSNDDTSQVIELEPSGYAYLPAPQSSWIVTNWGTVPVIASINDSLRLSFNGSSIVTLSYNGTVTDHNPGGLTIPNEDTVVVNVGFMYRTSSNSDASLRVVTPLLNSQFLTTSIPQSGEFPRSEGWALARYQLALPPSTRVFTVRVQVTESTGWVELRNTMMNVSYIQIDPQSSFGLALPIAGNVTLNLETSSKYTYVQSEGNGFVRQGNENVTIAWSSSPTWVELNSSGGYPLLISGKLAVSQIVFSQVPLTTQGTGSANVSTGDNSIDMPSRGSVVFARMYDAGYSLDGGTNDPSPIPTLDGMNLFVAAGPGKLSVALSTLLPLSIGYSVSLIADVAVVMVVFNISIRGYLGVRKRKLVALIHRDRQDMM